MYLAELKIENFRLFGEGDDAFVMRLRPGLTALVGENDKGKTAIIDALCHVLGTTDQAYIPVQDEDFYLPTGDDKSRQNILIRCKFDSLTTAEQGAYAEYLTYEKRDEKVHPVFYVNWIADQMERKRSGRRWINYSLRSGEDAEGPTLAQEVRDLLRATYLKPLRDAAREMSAGRNSRLSQILFRTPEVKSTGNPFDEALTSAVADLKELDPNTSSAPDDKDLLNRLKRLTDLSALGVGDMANTMLGAQEGIGTAQKNLNENYLSHLAFPGDPLEGRMVPRPTRDEDHRLKQMLEKLDLELIDPANGERDKVVGRPLPGLGSTNLLYMACELLLLGEEDEANRLLLIEEPEAHLHPQRQLRLIKILQEMAVEGDKEAPGLQVIISTHSPNLASSIRLDNLIVVRDGRAFPMHRDETKLSAADYDFLERFLDVTRANLFFARGVLIVEGDAENILIPAIAELLGQDFTEYGVSVVNVGSTGLGRYARIFLRRDTERDGEIRIPVACLADMDIMPDCAPAILGMLDVNDNLPDKNKRRWSIEGDFSEAKLTERRDAIEARADDQRVATYVSDHWTLEYDLAHAGLDKEVWTAAHLAHHHEAIARGSKTLEDVTQTAEEEFKVLAKAEPDDTIRAVHVYAHFLDAKTDYVEWKGTVSKSIAAQYLALLLTDLTHKDLRAKLPKYILDAIDYVTRGRALGA